MDFLVCHSFQNPDVCTTVDAGLSEKVNMLFAGTTIANGLCKALVVRTGMNTEIGKIQRAVMDAREDEEKTPLGQKIGEFGEWLGKVIMWICVIVWIMNFHQFSDPEFGGFFRGYIYDDLKLDVSTFPRFDMVKICAFCNETIIV